MVKLTSCFFKWKSFEQLFCAYIFGSAIFLVEENWRKSRPLNVGKIDYVQVFYF